MDAFSFFSFFVDVTRTAVTIVVGNAVLSRPNELLSLGDFKYII